MGIGEGWYSYLRLMSIIDSTQQTDGILDLFERPLRDLRISVTDRCNFRCTFCMPAEIFGERYRFLPKDDILTFGGDQPRGPALRRTWRAQDTSHRRRALLRDQLEVLIAQLASIDGWKTLR